MGDAKFLMYDFNNSTGKVTNEVNLPLETPTNKPYGVEFSSNSEKLYVHASNDFYSDIFTEWNNPTNHFSTLYQFDLSSNNTTTIVVSRKIIDSGNLFRGALQLGPDQKIYRSLSKTYNIGVPFLGVIENPENDGLLCNYKHDEISLGSRNGTQGLPPFIASIFSQIEITSVEDDNELITNQTLKLCVGSDYTFNSENLTENPTYTWTHDNNEINYTANLTLTNVQLIDAGVYELKVDLIDFCGFSKIYRGKFKIEVYFPPVISNTFKYIQCDFDEDSTDGITLFNLNTKLSEITNNDPNLEVLFYESQSKYDNHIPISTPSEYESSDKPQLLVEITNIQTGCYTTAFMELNVIPISLINYNNIYTCETDLSDVNLSDVKSIGSGKGTFDFEVIRNSIYDIFTDPTIEVEFYENSNDSQTQVNQISGINDYPNKEILVKISNKETNNCISMGTFNLIVNPIPIPEGFNEGIILCVNNPKDVPQLIVVNLNGSTGILGDTYQWYFNDTEISNAIEPTHDANEEGVYKVVATRKYETDSSSDIFCKGFNSFKVIESNLPRVDLTDINITDDSENNSISINTSNLGTGDYEYAIKKMNEFMSSFQYKPYFDHLAPGIYTIFIQDKNNCGVSQIEVSIIGFPKFFTPNNDGFNDTWKVIGVNENFYASSNIYIFDRFGKFITQINPKGEGWDGFFNGKGLPATDYWFSVELIDTIGNSRIRKGHFSLIRK